MGTQIQPILKPSAAVPPHFMAVVASTSDDFYANYAFETSDPKNENSIRVPRNTTENRRLKYGHTEDDNSDIAYLNFPVIVPSLIFTVISMGCFIGGIITSLTTDYIPDERELIRGYVIEYGSSRFRCNVNWVFWYSYGCVGSNLTSCRNFWFLTLLYFSVYYSIPSCGLPSILNLFELNVIGNVLFRYAVCIPVVIRVFNALTVRNLLRHEYSTKFSSLHKVMADSMPIFTFVEALMMSLFSIVTVHEDFPEANRFFKIVFAMSSVVNMLTTTTVMFAFSSNAESKWDTISMIMKLISVVIYVYFMPQYIQYHQSSITFPICHSYMPQLFALMEYVIIAAYAAFHLSFLIDIRNISFICFPRSASGECEPVDPTNFKKGAKYEHCRAFEYNQRRIMSL
ncbi:Protein CBG16685 [Caenorhabditis briggsae]|uniref:Protein CBG16685 n=1 Tax=Caenorhabditis briggsae TaxID=6238 RepID=A8XPB4_CAEBR|nr:Protein CBG16685 [Caenorhabditis briggsae]CAP34594.2 Protein CBG16685 [Caenorhabditis briggsae]